MAGTDPSPLDGRSPAGLATAEAHRRRAEDGPNELPRPRRRPMALRFAAELVHFFALMLWVAAALAWAAGLVQLTVAIGGVVVLNAVFSFIQEQRADRAAERLRVLLPSEVRVRRDGTAVAIDAADVVVGDRLLLEAGDRIPADATIVEAETVLIDTSMLTGESVSSAAGVSEPIFAGTFVVEGEAEAVVTATGRRTRLAAIATMSTETPRPTTPLTHELSRVVRTIAVISVSVGSVFLLLSWLLGDSLTDGLIFAIGVTVALVPEALLPTVTLSLAWGAEQMSHRNVLVRHLEAVETLGSTTFICTDKTGTLTRNQMTVVAAWTPDGSAEVTGSGYGPEARVVFDGARGRAAVLHLARVGALASTGFAARDESGNWAAHGEPMDAALDAFARRVGVDTDALRREATGAVRFPFDIHRRTTSAVIGDVVVLKGAPENVLPLCGTLDPDAHSRLDALTARGLRVLAIASRSWPVDETRSPSRDELERDLVLCGLVGLEDPPRADVGRALADCRRAGVRVAMLTGDHPATANAVAARIGLGQGRVVVSGDELPADDDDLGRLLDHDGIVVARVSPEDKLRIARALRSRGHVVAMTGDGVNDAPALHEADIGVAMGASGTDVAREAADLVLLDDNFASIVAGIEQGRATYVNIRRFLTYHLTDNVAELAPFAVWALSGGRFPLALGVLQILAIDLGTDTLTAVALGAEPPAGRILDDPPVSGRLLDRTVARRAFGVLGPTIALLTMLAFLVSLSTSGWRPGDAFPGGRDLAAASGAAFLTVVVGQAANAFACRSFTRMPWKLGWTTNRYLIPAIVFAFIVAGVALLVPAVAHQLDQAAPGWAGMVVATIAWPLVLTIDALDKRAQRPSLTCD